VHVAAVARKIVAATKSALDKRMEKKQLIPGNYYELVMCASCNAPILLDTNETDGNTEVTPDDKYRIRCDHFPCSGRVNEYDRDAVEGFTAKGKR
jgi:hypothetical protein